MNRLRRLVGIGRGARGRGFASRALGRSRDPTGGHYDPSARSSLDRPSRKLLAGEGAFMVLSLRAGTQKDSETCSWKRGPGIRNRRDGAPRGATQADKAGVHRRTGSRLLARRPPRLF